MADNTLLSTIKDRLGIPAEIATYDGELTSMITAAQSDIMASGVPSDLIDANDDRVILAIVFYVKQNYGDDRSNTTRYSQLYQNTVFRLCQEEGGT